MLRFGPCLLALAACSVPEKVASDDPDGAVDDAAADATTDAAATDAAADAAVDAAADGSTDAAIDAAIDAPDGPPETIIDSGPQGNVNYAEATFVFHASEAGSTFLCRLDGGGLWGCTSPHTFADVGQGDHTFEVHAIDVAGNPDGSPAVRAWSVDSLAPMVLLTGGPSGTAGPGAIFTFTANEGVPHCSLDGALATPCTSPKVYSLRPGNHTFTVEAFDPMNNRGFATRNWTVACAPAAPPGALGYFRMEDAAGSQVIENAIDGAPEAQLGATSSVEPTDPARVGGGRWGSGLRYAAGEMDQVTWPIGLTTNAFSVDLWVKPDLTLNASIIDQRITGNMFVLGAYAGGSSTGFYVYLDGDTGTHLVSSGPGVAMNVWHHVAITYAGTILRLYVDGVLHENSTATRTAALDLAGLQIGSPRANDMFVGELDELGFSTDVLTQQQALDRYCPL